MEPANRLDLVLESALDDVLEGYQIIAPDFRYIYVNSAAARHARVPKESLLGRTMTEVCPNIEQTPMFGVLQRCMLQRTTVQMEHEVTYPDGSRCWFEIRFHPVPAGLLISSDDITVRKRTEGELLRSRRVLGVISETNQALVAAVDEHDFVAAVCRIAIVRGGYRMACIGAKVHDATRSILPIASAGMDDGYTSALQLSWDPANPRGQGPSGRAVRTGEVVVARFISTDPAFEPWRRDALARGYSSAIALPFRVDGEVVGALVIYSAEPDAFDAHETHLLGELALDLGHGVQGLRARAESQRNAEQLARLNERQKRLARVVQAFSNMRDVPSMVDLVCRAARELVHADAATFVLREGAECVFLGEDAPQPFWKGRRFPVSGCVGGAAMSERETVTIVDVAADPRVPADAAYPPSVRGLAMVPIRREDPIGAIGVYWSTPYRATDDELGLLETLADSVAIEFESLRVLAELTESEVRYRTLVENLEDVVFALDADGRFSYVSPSIARFGFTPVEIVGRHFSSFVHPADLAGLAESFGRTIGGVVEPATFRVRARDGAEHIVRSSSRVVERGGRPVGVTGVMIDLTELRRAEEQLRAAQRLEAIGQLASGVAHDFNNLLAVILSYADFVGDAVRADAAASADVDEIVQAASRASALTRQLLAFGRKQVLQPQVVDLSRLVGDLEKMLRRLIGDDLELELRLAPNLGSIRADPGQMDQILMNLVVNARDAMRGGGTVTIETTNVVFDQEFVGDRITLPAGAFAVLTVSDTGSGMDEATKQRLFEPFYTTKEIGKGSGLGLPTVHGIVAQSGGSIGFTSELGVGTTFKIYFPCVERRGPEHPSVEVEPPRGSETILLVEDDRAVRAIGERILRGAGYEVLTAASGLDALEVWEAHGGAVDLLLTDVVMPPMNGKQLAQQLLERKPSLRVVFMSGYTDSALARQGILEPGARWIGKPFSARELGRQVRDALDATGDLDD